MNKLPIFLLIAVSGTAYSTSTAPQGSPDTISLTSPQGSFARTSSPESGYPGGIPVGREGVSCLPVECPPSPPSRTRMQRPPTFTPPRKGAFAGTPLSPVAKPLDSVGIGLTMPLLVQEPVQGAVPAEVAPIKETATVQQAAQTPVPMTEAAAPPVAEYTDPYYIRAKELTTVVKKYGIDIVAKVLREMEEDAEAGELEIAPSSDLIPLSVVVDVAAAYFIRMRDWR